MHRCQRNGSSSSSSKLHLVVLNLFMLVSLLVAMVLLAQQANGLIITSVIAGNKKFKTVSFESKFLKPLKFESDLPSTEFRRHRTMRPPKFDIDVNIPIKLPLEDEYPQEEYKKPVESNIFFQTGEINEPAAYGKYAAQPAKKSHHSAASYGVAQPKKPLVYKDEYAAASNQQATEAEALSPSALVSEGIKGLLPTLAKSIKFTPKIETVSQIQAAARRSSARSDIKEPQQLGFQQPNAAPMQARIMAPQYQQQVAPDLSQSASQYAGQQASHGNYQQKEPEFIPGGFVNLQLSGPSGGPQMTYEDFDREKWAQQLSQTYGAMPYPILNYHQLQNFYGGLGTFTNGIAEHRYVEHSILDKFKSGLNALTSKFHIG